MKKTYIQPNTVVVSIMHTQPIAGSDLGKVGSNYEGTLYDTNASSDGLVKGSSDVNVWDDEW